MREMGSMIPRRGIVGAGAHGGRKRTTTETRETREDGMIERLIWVVATGIAMTNEIGAAIRESEQMIDTGGNDSGLSNTKNLWDTQVPMDLINRLPL